MRQFKGKRNIRKSSFLKGLKRCQVARAQNLSGDETERRGPASTLDNLSGKQNTKKVEGGSRGVLYHLLVNLDLILQTVENLVEDTMVLFGFEVIYLGDSMKDV